jgi:alkanesulfonate monooxygenase SsuD/methylene tetrahydromethanopterin reductase-like flavin-dependent oxidoreductase (luciferase family)
MHLSIGIDVPPEARGPEGFAAFARRADRIEAARTDLVILAREAADGTLQPSRLEAVVQMPWLAGRLRTPALIASMPALHAVPFHIARALSAADFVSGGRAGWMPLTAGRQRFDHAYGSSYAVEPADVGPKYDDFIRATQALWDSWDADALILDKQSGAYLDSDKVRRVNYRGPFFATKGPLNAARPPQGYPLLVRDLDDVADSAVRADVVLGNLAALSAASGAVRLLKTSAATLDEGLAAIRAGAAEGLHLTGVDAVEQLEKLRVGHPYAAAQGDTARARLGLAKPENPYSRKVAV